jgi:hypothetical protein
MDDRPVGKRQLSWKFLLELPIAPILAVAQKPPIHVVSKLRRVDRLVKQRILRSPRIDRKVPHRWTLLDGGKPSASVARRIVGHWVVVGAIPRLAKIVDHLTTLNNSCPPIDGRSCCPVAWPLRPIVFHPSPWLSPKQNPAPTIAVEWGSKRLTASRLD